jgi:hypothetical protein
VASSLQQLAGAFLTPVEYRHRSASVGATIKTKDGKYVVVKLSGKSMNTHDIELVGGMVEKPEPLDNSKDLFNHLYKEMKEEAFIYKKDIDEMFLRAVLQAQKGSVLFHFEIKLNVTAKELKDRFKQKEKQRDKDITDLIFWSREEYLSYLANCGRGTKEALAGVV